ncbi:MAG: RNA polymerase sigma-70 factor [Roseiflexaceae bacterium]
MADIDLFQTHRPLLFGIAYRMLGSAAEAEDVVQDTYLRYAGARGEAVRQPRAYLSTIATRLALDRLSAARSSREHYIGPWLPEPVLTAPDDAPGTAERHESVSLAFLVLLETLNPQERAVFLLREVFEYEYEEIAAMLDLSTANCRQLLHRARARIAERRPRFQPAPEQRQRLVEQFTAAVERGDVQGLAALLIEEVVYTADGGGKVQAARRPVRGNDAVARLLLGLMGRVRNLPEFAGARLVGASINGGDAMLVLLGDRIDTMTTWEWQGGRIAAFHAVRNPDKLAFLQRQLDGGLPLLLR